MLRYAEILGIVTFVLPLPAMDCGKEGSGTLKLTVTGAACSET